ncbi:MAG: hypothetical protein ACJ786_19530 [Catenulispora sp.]
MVHARSVRLAAVIVLGGAVALAATGCGGPMQAGAAAVIQGERTSDRDVQSDVASVVSMVERAGLTQGAGVSDSQRAALAKAQISLLVQEAMWQKVADDLGVSVGPDADAKQYSVLVTSARATLGAKFTGSDNEAVALADIETQQASGVAPSVVPVFVHTKALANAVVTSQATQLGIDPNANANDGSGQKLQDAIGALLQKAAAEIDVKVSPRYGAFDPKNGQIVQAATSWIRSTNDQLAAQQQQQQQQPQ